MSQRDIPPLNQNCVPFSNSPVHHYLFPCHNITLSFLHTCRFRCGRCLSSTTCSHWLARFYCAVPCDCQVDSHGSRAQCPVMSDTGAKLTRDLWKCSFICDELQEKKGIEEKLPLVPGRVSSLSTRHHG